MPDLIRHPVLNLDSGFRRNDDFEAFIHERNKKLSPTANEAPRSKLRGIKAKLRRSQPAFALKSFGAVRHAIHPCSKLQGILAKANKI